MVFTGADAEAKRMGGGKSVGKQSSNVTQREAAPAAAKPAAPAAAPAAAAPKRPWGAMLGGLAAGLGLAWLASSLGFGEGMAQFMTFALAALAIMLVVGFVLRYLKSRREGAGQASESPFAFQGAGASPAPGYSPANVGNDASARPWERASTAFEASPAANGTSAQGGSMIGSALLGAQTWGVPAGFDSEGFLAACKTNFVTLQGAWDRSDISALREMMTDEMLDQIKTQLAERESHTGGTVNKTDVLRLDAQLLGIEETTEVYLASVEFSGMIREDESAGPSRFREVWNMSKPRHGAGGWLVAGVQALQ
ncbi:MAG: Tim44-like domain-containing protein [Polaromonas sp.]|nr:Tim44-like domain-containing protein [Polaromonas sp.]